MSDTFGVGIQITETELQFLVRVPSSIDSGWSDPQIFQKLVETVVWDTLDREEVLGTLATNYETGTTVSLGTVTLEPDGTVVATSLEVPSGSEAPGGSEVPD